MRLGKYIKKLRESRGIGQRELARNISVSPSYLNDIEKGKRKYPSKSIIRKLAYALEANIEFLFDLTSKQSDRIPQDIPDIIKKYPSSIQLLRSFKKFNLEDNEIVNLLNRVLGGNMKAVIIAAGKGSRLKHYTEDLPKCMLKFNGKTLLERQINALKSNGIKDISVIKGYCKEKINLKGVKYYINNDYENNNILNSLFYAEKELNSDVIISYSDILYEKDVISRLIESKYDISIVVDIDWKKAYRGRKDHPIHEAENVIFDSHNKVLRIGKIMTKKFDVHGEFIGIMKLTKRGCDILKRHFSRAKMLFWNKPYVRAKTFNNAYLTDMIQDMVELGVDIHCVIIERGWKEIDTVEDYEKALKEFKEK